MSDFLSQLVNSVAEFSVTFGYKLIEALALLIIGFKVVNIFSRKLKKSAKNKNKIDESAASFLFSCITFILKAVIVLSAINLMGVPMSSMVAVIGSAGLAVGLSLQGSLSNLAGRLMITIFRPFNVGDYIITDGIEGTVNSISILYTVIFTPDNKQITVPNATISNSVITNCTAEKTRRVDMTFTVSYSSDIETTRKVLLETMKSNPLVLDKPAEPFARVSKHDDSAIVFTTRCWCNTSDYWTVWYDLNEQVKCAFDKAQIEIPFPQMDIHVKED